VLLIANTLQRYFNNPTLFLRLSNSQSTDFGNITSIVMNVSYFHTTRRMLDTSTTIWRGC